ncbi:MAG: hypothetical protein IJ512_04135 [Ruminococcus sp.]|nr:hypothetical protein [Ruminococcus sp.]
MENKNQLGLISTIAGVVALVLSVIGLFGGFAFRGGWLALIAIVLGIVAIVLSASSKKNGGKGNAGMVMGIIALIVGVIAGLCCIICNCAGYYAVTDAVYDAAGDLNELAGLYDELY